MAKGLFITLTNCTDPAREKEFNEWYDKFVQDLCKLPGWVGARRYEKVQLPSGPLYDRLRDTPAQYLAVYEIEADDIVEAIRVMRENHPPVINCLTSSLNVAWKFIGPEPEA